MCAGIARALSHTPHVLPWVLTTVACASGPCLAAAQDSASATTHVVGDSGATLRVGVLRSGDVLRIGVYRLKELSGDFTIDSRGVVQIPGLGDVVVAGLSPEGARARIRERLIAGGISAPDFSLEPLIRVFVVGEVHQSGIIPLDPGTSMLQLLARVGPTDQADLRHAKVVREGRPIAVDLESALTGSPTGRYVLYSNDVLVVPRRRVIGREAWGFALSTITSLLSIATFVVTLRRY